MKKKHTGEQANSPPDVNCDSRNPPRLNHVSESPAEPVVSSAMSWATVVSSLHADPLTTDATRKIEPHQEDHQTKNAKRKPHTKTHRKVKPKVDDNLDVNTPLESPPQEPSGVRSWANVVYQPPKVNSKEKGPSPPVDTPTTSNRKGLISGGPKGASVPARVAAPVPSTKGNWFKDLMQKRIDESGDIPEFTPSSYAPPPVMEHVMHKRAGYKKNRYEATRMSLGEMYWEARHEPIDQDAFHVIYNHSNSILYASPPAFSLFIKPEMLGLVTTLYGDSWYNHVVGLRPDLHIDWRSLYDTKSDRRILANY
eukprot:GHVH01001286.1.p1 GENE.GHVH01001286.1~~GHVH01001286.1.p1  ORF type:complete len:310 (-),score=31.15 GHVH01001286.1:151-1080(-)